MIVIFGLFKKKSQVQQIHKECINPEHILIYAENVWEKNIKVGNKVLIREDIKNGDHYGQFTFRSYMEKYRGMEATVISKKKPRYKENFSEIRLDIDKGGFLWDVTMFKSVIG